MQPCNIRLVLLMEMDEDGLKVVPHKDDCFTIYFIVSTSFECPFILSFQDIMNFLRDIPAIIVVTSQQHAILQGVSIHILM